MKIALLTNAPDGNNDGGNARIEETVAAGWKKYLAVYNVEIDIYQRNHRPSDQYNAVIHFDPVAEPWPNLVNILYCAKTYAAETCPGGTVGQFHRNAHKFKYFIFVSSTLRDNCESKGPVVPLAIDPEIYKPVKPTLDCSSGACFVSHGHRNHAIDRKYLAPAIPFGLAVYGAATGWSADLLKVHRGDATRDQEAEIYAGSKVCLNCHSQEQLKHDIINHRTYCILACGGTIISDKANAFSKGFQDHIRTTIGDDDLTALLKYYTGRKVTGTNNGAIQFIRAQHTFADRAKTIYDFLRSNL